MEWARRVGVTRLKVGELELELGPAPSSSLDGGPDASTRTERQARVDAHRERLEVEWGHVGGVSALSDEQVEQVLLGKARFP